MVGVTHGGRLGGLNDIGGIFAVTFGGWKACVPTLAVVLAEEMAELKLK